MPDNIKRLISAGFDMGLMSRLLTDGYTPGGLNGAISNGASAAAKRMYGVKTAPIGLPEPVTVTITGDDTRLGIFTFDPAELPSFNMTVGELDMDIVAQSQGTNIYQVAAYYEINVLAPVGRDFNDCILWFVSQAKSRTSGSRGAGFHNIIIPRCQLSYLGRNLEERGAGTFTFKVDVDTFDTFPWGQALTLQNVGATEAAMFEWFTNKRPQWLTIKDDTTTDSYSLDYAPWVDGNSNVRFIAWRNGQLVGNTGSTGAVAVAADGTVTLGAGLTGRSAGDTIYIFAEVA